MAVRVWVLAAGYGIHAKALLDLEVMTDDANWHSSPAWRLLVRGVVELIKAGHPNVPGALRYIANDLQKNPPKKSKPEETKSGTVISMATGETLD